MRRRTNNLLTAVMALHQEDWEVTEVVRWVMEADSVAMVDAMVQLRVASVPLQVDSVVTVLLLVASVATVPPQVVSVATVPLQVVSAATVLLQVAMVPLQVATVLLQVVMEAAMVVSKVCLLDSE